MNVEPRLVAEVRLDTGMLRLIDTSTSKSTTPHKGEWEELSVHQTNMLFILLTLLTGNTIYIKERSAEAFLSIILCKWHGHPVAHIHAVL